MGQSLSGDGPEFMPWTQSRCEGHGSAGAPSKLLTVVWGRVFGQSSAPGSTPTYRPWCLNNPLPLPTQDSLLE